MALGSTQPLTEMSTRNLPGGKGRSARKADNSPLSVSRCGSLNVLQPCGSPRPVTSLWPTSRCDSRICLDRLRKTTGNLQQFGRCSDEIHTRDKYPSKMTLKHSYLAVIHDFCLSSVVFWLLLVSSLPEVGSGRTVVRSPPPTIDFSRSSL
jgi:hypothetical protein